MHIFLFAGKSGKQKYCPLLYNGLSVFVAELVMKKRSVRAQCIEKSMLKINSIFRFVIVVAAIFLFIRSVIFQLSIRKYKIQLVLHFVRLHCVSVYARIAY